MIGYHVTYANYFDEIVERGLEVRDTREHNWNISNHPGVYFWTDERMARDWGCVNISCHEERRLWERCIIVFEVPDEDEVWGDRVYDHPSSRFSMVPIPPENLIDVLPIGEDYDAYYPRSR